VSAATALLGVLAAALAWVAWRRGDGSFQQGLTEAWRTVRQTGPLLGIAFLIVGYVQVLAPQQWVQTWIGPESGWRGLLLGEVIGMVLPGGPYVVFPLIAALYRAGAGVGPAVTIITSWAMLGLLSVSFELPFMGWRFTIVRWTLGLGFPVLCGAVATMLFG